MLVYVDKPQEQTCGSDGKPFLGGISVSNQYYVRRGSKISGPAQAKLLEQYAANGKLQATDQVSTSQNGPWHAVSQVPMLASHLPAPDPLGDPLTDPLGVADPGGMMAADVRSQPVPRASQKQVKPAKRPAWLLPVIAGGGVLSVLLLAAGVFFFSGGSTGGQADSATVGPSTSVGVAGSPQQTAAAPATLQPGNHGGARTTRDDRRAASEDRTDGETPLHQAAEDGDLDAAAQLLADGADVNSVQHKDGETPLHRAITRGQTKMAELLLEHGANVNLGRGKDGTTPLAMAERQGREKIAQLIREKLAEPEGEQQASENAPAAKGDLSEALLGKRVHFTIGGETGWTEFHANRVAYFGEGQERKPGVTRWSTTGNKLKVQSGSDDDYLVFTDPAAAAGSEVIFLNSANKDLSVGTKGTIVRVEPIGPPTDLQGPGRKLVIDFMTSMATGDDLEKSTYLSYPKEQFIAWAQASGEGKAQRVWDLQTGDWEARRKQELLRRLGQISASLKPLKLDLSTLRIIELDSTDDVGAELETSSHYFELRLDDCLQTPRGLLIFDIPQLKFESKGNRGQGSANRQSRGRNRDRTPKLSPFSRVSCQGDVAMVTYQDQTYQLVSLNGLTTKQILDFCKQRYGSGWEKRFAEDLVDVLVGMGQEVSTTCALVLRDRTGKTITVQRAPMTNALRQQVYEARYERQSAAPGQRGGATANARLDQSVATAVLTQLQQTLKDRWAYYQAGNADFDRFFELTLQQARKGQFSGARGLQQFQAVLSRLIGQGIDGHARIEVAGAQTDGPFLPFLIRPIGDRYVAFKPDRSGFLDADAPFITHLGANATEMISVDTLIEQLRPYSPQGSVQYCRHQALRLARRVGLWKNLLNIKIGNQLTVKLQGQAPTSSDPPTRTLSLAQQFPLYGSFPRHGSQILENQIGYLRIAAMDEQAVADIQSWMPRFQNTRGLIIDVRGNGGGRRTPLLAIASVLMQPQAPAIVVNAAKYRLHPDFGESHLQNRFLYPTDSPHWNHPERQAIAAFVQDFAPEWNPAVDQFSEWHYMVLSQRAGQDSYHYDRPVVVLVDDRCFSATDIFLAGMKQLPGVTLLGTPSGGGSARSVSRQLGPVRVRLASMASFQPDGKLFDGHGVKPNVIAHPSPAFFIGGEDRVLATAIRHISG